MSYQRSGRIGRLYTVALVLMALATRIAAWTDYTCNRDYRTGTVACLPQLSPTCACGNVVWHSAASSGFCCFKSKINTCAYINDVDGAYQGSSSWSLWTSWSACSSSCGEGRISRSRKCSGTCIGSCIPGLSVSTSKSCTGGEPRAWSSWGGWSNCDTNCGSGSRVRRRSCVGTCGSCTSGTNKETESCSVGVPRTWTNWGAYGGCSAHCGAGVRTRHRLCSGTCGACSGSPGSSSTIYCSVGTPRSWSSWGGWGSCSTECGTGLRTRARSCSVGNCGTCNTGHATETRECDVGIAAAWTQWGSWSDCSTACGAGSTMRTRTCAGTCEGACSLGATEQDTASCLLAEPRAWESWQPWGPCVGCGIGEQNRTRACTGTCEGSCAAAASETATQPCSADTPATWTAWTAWDACSGVCGIGKQSQNRTCNGECSGTCGAPGHVDTLSRDCVSTASAIPGAWTSWGSCNGVCGSSNRSRIRQCSAGCASDACSVSCEVHEEQESCTDAHWTHWSDWATVCSTACGVGNVTRTRHCEGSCQTASAPCVLNASDTSTRPCAAGVAAAWAAWEPHVCVDNMRPWTRTCIPNCHGTCDGNATELRNCTWAGLQLWAGPLRPHAAAPLTLAVLAQDVSPRAREALVAALGNKTGMIDSFQPRTEQQDVSSSRQRRTSHIDAGIVTRADEVEGNVWVAMVAYVLPAARTTLKAALPLNVNITGTAVALPGGQLVLATTPDVLSPASPQSSRAGTGSSAALVAGVVIACLLVLLVVMLVFQRQQKGGHNQFPSPLLAGTDGTTTLETEHQEAWMMRNPVFKPREESSTEEDAPPLPLKANRSSSRVPASGAPSRYQDYDLATDTSAYDVATDTTSDTVAAAVDNQHVRRRGLAALTNTNASLPQPAPVLDNVAYLPGEAEPASNGALCDNPAYVVDTPAAPQLPSRDAPYYLLASSCSSSDPYYADADHDYASITYTGPTPPTVPKRDDTYLLLASKFPRGEQGQSEAAVYASITDDDTAVPAIPPRDDAYHEYLAISPVAYDEPASFGSRALRCEQSGVVHYYTAAGEPATNAYEVPVPAPSAQAPPRPAKRITSDV